MHLIFFSGPSIKLSGDRFCRISSAASAGVLDVSPYAGRKPPMPENLECPYCGQDLRDVTKQMHSLLWRVEALKAIIKAIIIETPQGQPCYRTINGVPMEMPKRVELLVRKYLPL